MLATPVILKEDKIHPGVMFVNFKKCFVKDQKNDKYCCGRRRLEKLLLHSPNRGLGKLYLKGED